MHEIQDQCDDIWTSMDFSIGSSNDISRIINKLENESQNGMIFYAYARNLERATEKLALFGFEMDWPYADEDIPGYIFIFIRAQSNFDWDSDPSLSQSESEHYWDSEEDTDFDSDICDLFDSCDIVDEVHDRSRRQIVSYHHYYNIKHNKKENKLVRDLYVDYITT